MSPASPQQLSSTQLPCCPGFFPESNLCHTMEGWDPQTPLCLWICNKGSEEKPGMSWSQTGVNSLLSTHTEKRISGWELAVTIPSHSAKSQQMLDSSSMNLHSL